jgi:hypothetical protein
MSKNNDGPYQDTICDVLFRLWQNDKPKLKAATTPAQFKWIEAYIDLAKSTPFDGNWRPQDTPTVPRVAKKLGISRQASLKMQRRILNAIRDLYRSVDEINMRDEKYHMRASKLEETLLKNPKHIVLTHGQEAKYCELIDMPHRFGMRSYKTGYTVKKITKKESEALKQKGVPIEEPIPNVYTFQNEWWDPKTKEYALKNGIEYAQAHMELEAEYNKRWPEDVAMIDRHCRNCGTFLPYGEIINGKKITKSRKYCPIGNCKKYYYRYR